MNDDKALNMLSALSQKTRFQVFRLLMANGCDGMAAGKIAENLAVPQNTLSSHLTILTNAGLITMERQGRHLIYKAAIGETRDFIEFLVSDCCQGNPEICELPFHLMKN